MTTVSMAGQLNPFPGLRAFREGEDYVFFGRDSQVDAIVDKLASTHFLAVVGTSGSGKSSLINCGLCPALSGGRMSSANAVWRMAKFRPGSDPLIAMASSLAEDGVLFQDYHPGNLTLTEIIDTTLRMSKLGLIDIYEQAKLGKDVNLLLIVDQFEELFRYQLPGSTHGESGSSVNEVAKAFVKLLLEATANRKYPIYVVLTIRSEFLGDCSYFSGLAKRINEGLYLVPQMTRDESRAAIIGPARVSGAEVSPVLQTRLLNDLGDNQDQLPILQHALNRIWAHWLKEGRGDGPLDLAHYEAIGTMAHAMDRYAEKAYAELGNIQKRKICEKLFKILTDNAMTSRGVRHPTTLGNLCILTNSTKEEVIEVIDVFRQPNSSFLMPPTGEIFTAETVVDISHESLIWGWKKLGEWVEEEATNAKIYSQLAKTAELYALGNPKLYKGAKLNQALKWMQGHDKYWASRYPGDFAMAEKFLQDSKDYDQREKNKKQQDRDDQIRDLLIQLVTNFPSKDLCRAMIELNIGGSIKHWLLSVQQSILTTPPMPLEISVETSEAEIAVHWKEEELYYPSPGFIAQANLTDESIFDRFSLENFPDCYTEFAELLTWYKYWDEVLDTSDAPCFKWFKGGKLNASYNCIDRHLKDNKNKTAIHFVPELEEERVQHVTYQELYVRVNEFAALLRDTAGLKRGDRVTIHMPMSAELPITMLACARLGVIHSVVFGGFSSSACADRAVDSNSRVLITMDAYYRAGNLQNHKAVDDEACELAEKDGQKVDKLLIWQRYPGEMSTESALVEGRDIIVNDELKKYYGARVEPEQMLAEEPLFLMYTSGTTGKPKGAQHGTGGYLSYVTAMSKYIQDIHPTDVYWCMADIGWITGHSFIVYGPLALCASSVIYEGVPTYPDAGRSWRIAQDLDVNIFHTAPTAIRALRKVGPDEPAKHNYNFKHMTTVGEPIEPEVWKWYEKEVGKGKAVIVDTYWQTETGGFLCSTVPGLAPMKPGSAGPGVPGIHPIVFDEDGKEIPAGAGKAGNICIQNPWPGCFMTIWGDRDRFVDTYFAMYNKDPNSKDWKDWPYLTGDVAVVADDGYVRILGRIDDVINVSGHLLGTKEIESVALTVQEVAEAAVVPVNHEIKGKEPELYVSLKPGIEATPEIQQKVADAITFQIGKIAKCKNVWIVPDMPKTRSGKIMRRVLAAISNKGDVGNVMTLANPEIVEDIQKRTN